jgi:hypothetical protein
MLLWCRDCGHLASRPCVGNEHVSIPTLLQRARCGSCKGRNIGARKTYELGLPGPGVFHIWELRLIAEALSAAAAQCNQLAQAELEAARRDGFGHWVGRAGCYLRLAGIYHSEIAQREALPMHALPKD